jgi:hypothetical protein
MTEQERMREVLERLRQAYPTARIRLRFSSPVRAAHRHDPLGAVHR